VIDTINNDSWSRVPYDEVEYYGNEPRVYRKNINNGVFFPLTFDEWYREQ
jgi:hypothetical protein